VFHVLSHVDPSRATTAQEVAAAARVVAMQVPVDGRHPYNSPPPGFREVDEAYVARSMLGTYSPLAVEHRQVPLPDATGREVFTSLTLYHYWDGTGIGFACDYWAKRVRWFAFGCAHPEHTIHRCPGCGHAATIDSSD
jgi:hypothetical protein